MSAFSFVIRLHFSERARQSPGRFQGIMGAKTGLFLDSFRGGDTTGLVLAIASEWAGERGARMRGMSGRVVWVASFGGGACCLCEYGLAEWGLDRGGGGLKAAGGR